MVRNGNNVSICIWYEMVKTFVTVISASTGRNDCIFDIWLLELQSFRTITINGNGTKWLWYEIAMVRNGNGTKGLWYENNFHYGTK
jgi:hypothetical protein